MPHGWVLAFRKGETVFVLSFSATQFDDMLMATMRAKAVGYVVKTFPAKQ